jgi:CheY-like chemotaxis protein
LSIINRVQGLIGNNSSGQDKLKALIDEYTRENEDIQRRLLALTKEKEKEKETYIISIEQTAAREAELKKQVKNLEAELEETRACLNSDILFYKEEIARLVEQLKAARHSTAGPVPEKETKMAREIEVLKAEISRLEHQNHHLQSKTVAKEEVVLNFIGELVQKIEVSDKEIKETKIRLQKFEHENSNTMLQNLELVNQYKKEQARISVTQPDVRTPVEIKQDPESENKGFSGDIVDISLIDFLQMLVVSNKQRLIHITDSVTDKIGKIFVKESDVIHAEYGDSKGFDAFSEIISIRNGNFSSAPWSDPSERSINLSSMNLFMEAARIIDEQNARLKTLEVPIGDIQESNETRKVIFSQIQESIRADKAQINLLNKKLGGGGDPLLASRIRKQIIEENDRGKRDMNKGINKILVVDDSVTIVSLMKKYLSSQGFNVTTTNSAAQCIDLLTLDSYDLVITDINMPDINGIELVLWIRENRPEVQIIMMTAFGSDEIKEFASQKGALRYFDKPLNLKHIREVIEELSKNKGLEGNLVDINIFDFVQMIVLSRKQKLILIKDPVTKQTGKLYISYGDIIHAECGNLHGIDAFYSIMAMKTGHFTDTEWSDPEVKTINATPMKLFLEAIRKIDMETSEIQAIEKNLEMLNGGEPVNIIPKGEKSKKDSFIILEKGSALGITIAKTTKKEVLEIMKEFSSIDFSAKDKFASNMFIYEDISLIIHFDEEGTAKELNFGNYYPGLTSRGIAIGDTVEKAIKAYGTPRFSSNKGVIWDKIAILCRDSNYITSIRVS